MEMVFNSFSLALFIAVACYFITWWIDLKGKGETIVRIIQMVLSIIVALIQIPIFSFSILLGQTSQLLFPLIIYTIINFVLWASLAIMHVVWYNLNRK